MSAPELWDLRDRSGAFENIPAIWRADANMMGAEKPERIELLGTSTNYFGMLGAHAQIGRLYNAFVHPGSTVLTRARWR